MTEPILHRALADTPASPTDLTTIVPTGPTPTSSLALQSTTSIHNTATTTSVHPHTPAPLTASVAQQIQVLAGTASTSLTSTLPDPMQQLMRTIQAEQAKCPIPTSTPGHAPGITSSLALQQQEYQASESATDATKSKKKRKEADPNFTMWPSANSGSARNLYAIEWCKQNRGGKRGEFAAAWSAMEANKDPLIEVRWRPPVLLISRPSSFSGIQKAFKRGKGCQEESRRCFWKACLPRR